MLVDLEGITLNVRDEGYGPAVVLLHGWPDTHYLWRHQFPSLVAAGYRAIAPDLRGCGESSRPAEVDAYAARLVVGDVVGLLDRLEIEQAHLVGHDWGAAFAWMTAAHFPDRVATLTVLSVGHPNPLPPLDGHSARSPGTCCCFSSKKLRINGFPSTVSVIFATFSPTPIWTRSPSGYATRQP